jgi:hypothetical protein
LPAPNFERQFKNGNPTIISRFQSAFSFMPQTLACWDLKVFATYF